MVGLRMEDAHCRSKECCSKSDCSRVEVNLATVTCWVYYQILNIGVSLYGPQKFLYNVNLPYMQYDLSVSITQISISAFHLHSYGAQLHKSHCLLVRFSILSTYSFLCHLSLHFTFPILSTVKIIMLTF